MAGLVVHAQGASPTDQPPVPADLASYAISKGPSAVEEAKRVMKLFSEDFKRVVGPGATSFHQPQDRSLYLEHVKICVSKLFPWKLTLPTDRFPIHDLDGLSHLDVLYLPIVDSFLLECYALINALIKGVLSDFVHRILGSMGMGKSFAAFVLFIRHLSAPEDLYRLCYIPDPVKMFMEPNLLVEHLLLVFHAADDDLKDNLKTWHDAAKREPHLREVIVSEALKACRLYCAKNGLKFVILMDQENRFYSQNVDPRLSALVSSLSSADFAHLTILVSSASNPQVVAPTSYVRAINHDLAIDPEFSPEKSLYKLFVDTLPSQNHLQAWVAYFGGEDAFIKVLQDMSYGCPLEVRDMIMYLSDRLLEPSIVDPWSDYLFEESVVMSCSHIAYMKESLKATPDGLKGKREAYALLMEMLDYHRKAPRAECATAGKLLWGRLRSVLNLKQRPTALRSLIDARWMTIRENETPKSTSRRAAFILSSLPKTKYLKYPIFDRIQEYLKSLPTHVSNLAEKNASFQGHLIEDAMYQLLRTKRDICLEGIRASRGKNSSEAEVESEPIFRLDISVFLKVFFDKDDIAEKLTKLLERFRRNRWIVLFPDIPNFPQIDFALLYLPKGRVPPVLFPIQVTNNVMGHKRSGDILFRTGDNPLMKAFRQATSGKGRVQFVWVGSKEKDLKVAVHDPKFDTNSVFTNIDDWKQNLGHREPIAIDWKTLGYACGDIALTAEKPASPVRGPPERFAAVKRRRPVQQSGASKKANSKAPRHPKERIPSDLV